MRWETRPQAIALDDETGLRTRALILSGFAVDVPPPTEHFRGWSTQTPYQVSRFVEQIATNVNLRLLWIVMQYPEAVPKRQAAAYYAALHRLTCRLADASLLLVVELG